MLTSDEIAERFEGVHLKRQSRVLKASLYLMARAAAGMADGVQHLEQIARSHDKKGYDIKPAYYDHWLDSLLLAAAETDPDFDDTVKAAWVASLRPCIEVMTVSWLAK